MMSTEEIYLEFAGHCQEAFDFYRTVFGGDFGYASYFDDAATQQKNNSQKFTRSRIKYISLAVGSSILIGSDYERPHSPAYHDLHNSPVSILTANEEETKKVFSALAENGKIILSLSKTYWGEYFGMLIDRFNIVWMISCRKRELSKLLALPPE